MKKKNKLRIPLCRALAAACCFLVLQGCAPAPSASSLSCAPAAPDSAPTGDAPAPAAPDWRQDPALLADLSPTPSHLAAATGGAYLQDNGLLCYIDAATAALVPLCAAPSCAHDGAECTAWLYGQPGFRAFAADGESLYFFRTPVYDAGAGETASDDAFPALVRTDPSGADARVLYRCASGESLSLSGIDSAADCARDRDHLYFFTTLTQDGAVLVSRLMTLTLSTGEVTARPLPPLAQGQQTAPPRFAGVWGRRLLLEQDTYTLGAADAESGVFAIENQTTHLFALDPATLAAEALCEVPPDYLDAAAGQYGVHTVSDGVLYSFRYPSFDEGLPGGYVLTARDLASGEQRTLFEAQRHAFPGTVDYTFPPAFLAGQIFFSLRQDEPEFGGAPSSTPDPDAASFSLWAVGLAAGEARDATVPCVWSTGAQGVLMPRALLSGGLILAEAGATLTPATQVWEDGTVTRDPDIQRNYVLIPLDDLLAGRDASAAVARA